MEIRKYQIDDLPAIFQMMQREEDDWSDYCDEDNQEKYKKAMNHSIAYVILEDDTVCGYIRCKDDDGYGIYILDLLVSNTCRGKSYGRYLMKAVCDDYKDMPVYVTSDVDPYYEKQGCEKVGTVFAVEL